MIGILTNLLECLGQLPGIAAELGLVGLLLTAIWGAVKATVHACRHRRHRKQEMKFLRTLISEDIQGILEAKDIAAADLPQGMEVTEDTPADVVRVAQFNILMKKIGVALERWTPNLTPFEKKEIYDALDWYHTGRKPGNMYTVPYNGKLTFPFLNSHHNPPHPTWVVDNYPHPDRFGSPLFPVVTEGRWPVKGITLEQAEEKFKALQDIRWLKLKA